jgi:hypothetical protein
MYSIVKRLRHRGIRKHDREIQSDTGTRGDMTLALCSGGCELKLAADDGSRQEPVIPVLYEARLVTMHSAKMLFKGIERAPDGAECCQEWSVLVIGGGQK